MNLWFANDYPQNIHSNISLTKFQARGSMLMFVAAFLTFMAIGGFPSFVEDMKVSLFC